MGTAFGAMSKSWTYRYNQRIPGADAVYHGAESFILFKGVSFRFVLPHIYLHSYDFSP